ncbi:MAG: sulfate transporter CysZ [Halioglobus sp.]|nr:sulfate transporter CysZ [Halioglobus sp.]
MRGNFVRGAGYLVRGAEMLSHPALRKFVIIPLAINILIFAALLGIGFAYINALVDSLLSRIPEWLGFIEWILWLLILLTVGLIYGYCFTAVTLLIASPFNALLAEKAEELITGEQVSGPEGLGVALLMVPKSLLRELKKLLYYLPIALVVLLLSLIPGVGAIAWLLLGAWMMSIQFVDYPMDNHHLDFSRVKQAIRSRRLSSLGFGGFVALCTSVPLLNFFVVPAAVVGATLLWCEELSQT